MCGRPPERETGKEACLWLGQRVQNGWEKRGTAVGAEMCLGEGSQDPGLGLRKQERRNWGGHWRLRTETEKG